MPMSTTIPFAQDDTTALEGTISFAQFENITQFWKRVTGSWIVNLAACRGVPE